MGEERLTAFLISSRCRTLAAGLINYWHTGRSGFVRYRESFAIVSVLADCWHLPLACCLFCSDTFDSVTKCAEAVSGFTTTGATVLQDIESQPHGILFWRTLSPLAWGYRDFGAGWPSCRQWD